MENKNIFAQWDKTVNMESLQKDIAEAKENGKGDFKEVPHGKYEVSIEKMELKATKKTNKPMVSVWFNIVSGDYKGQKLFMNQVIDPNSEWRGMQIHNANEFLRSLLQDCADAPVVEFITFAQYANLLMDIHELIADSFEYALDYGQTKKGFDTFEITEVYALED
jgi:hypothetical protein